MLTMNFFLVLPLKLLSVVSIIYMLELMDLVWLAQAVLHYAFDAIDDFVGSSV